MPRRSFSRLVSSIAPKQVNDLSTDQINLLNFLVLVVDIKYRFKYGCSLQSMNEKNITNEVLPDQLPFVDDGLEGVSRRRISDAGR